jgi:hypothetical protein
MLLGLAWILFDLCSPSWLHRAGHMLILNWVIDGQAYIIEHNYCASWVNIVAFLTYVCNYAANNLGYVQLKTF